eukprot:TRINITY_DN1816_c2_g1_i1.p1 TRINITY_DN1816_c2_g1~~TRINITY_DN1816_c2_g1_i1.p1  ORF type:complete len:300 (+),score=114.56 TRINITY_DN1816_c2_g1_i1:51-902(+)
MVIRGGSDETSSAGSNGGSAEGSTSETDSIYNPENDEASTSDEEVEGDDDDDDDDDTPRAPLMPERKGALAALQRIQEKAREKDKRDYDDDDDEEDTPVVTTRQQPPKRRRVVIDERPLEDRALVEDEILQLLHSSEAAVRYDARSKDVNDWRERSSKEAQEWLARYEREQLKHLQDGTLISQMWTMPASGHPLPSAAPVRKRDTEVTHPARLNTVELSRQSWSKLKEEDADVAEEIRINRGSKHEHRPQQRFLQQSRLAREQQQEAQYQEHRDKELARRGTR